MKAHGGVEVHLQSFLTTALDAGEWHTSRPDCFSSGTQSLGGWLCPRADCFSPGTQSLGGWLCPEPVSTLWRKGNPLTSAGNRNASPLLPAHGLVVIPTSVMRLSLKQVVPLPCRLRLLSFHITLTRLGKRIASAFPGTMAQILRSSCAQNKRQKG
jgi:hypothetical protein